MGDLLTEVVRMSPVFKVPLAPKEFSKDGIVRLLHAARTDMKPREEVPNNVNKALFWICFLWCTIAMFYENARPWLQEAPRGSATKSLTLPGAEDGS